MNAPAAKSVLKIVYQPPRGMEPVELEISEDLTRQLVVIQIGRTAYYVPASAAHDLANRIHWIAERIEQASSS